MQIVLHVLVGNGLVLHATQQAAYSKKKEQNKYGKKENIKRENVFKPN